MKRCPLKGALTYSLEQNVLDLSTDVTEAVVGASYIINTFI